MKTVVLNAQKMNYDQKLDLSVIGDDLTVYDDTLNELILERVQGCEAVVTKELLLNAETILSFPSCVKLICEAGTGFNNIDIDACKEKNITVCNVPSYSSQRVAHLAISFILNFSSSLHLQQSMLSTNNRSNFSSSLKVSHHEVNDKTLGVIGYGNIGKEVIKVATALGMNILVYTRTKRSDLNNIKFVDLNTLLTQSDYISLHCPLNEETKHIINKESIQKMKSTAFLINTSRGSLVDEPALIEALQNHVIAGAALDVQEIEPPLDNNPLYTLENVQLTPHIGWKGLETRQRLIAIVAKNIQSFFKDNPINVVSK